MSDWFSNNEKIDSIAIDDRCVQYGDGLFETVAIREGEPRLWQYHFDRLQNGCERLGISTPGQSALLESLQFALRGASADTTYCVAKIIVTAGIGQRGYGRSATNVANIVTGVFPSSPLAVEKYKFGIDTILCDTRLATGSILAGLKTLNRLEQVVARTEVLNAKCFEGLTMDADGCVICGTMSNVFFVKNKTISTPSIARCGVEGVMRRHVIETLRASGVATETWSPKGDSLHVAEEVFVSNSQFGVIPVKSCGENVWGVGETTINVIGAMAASGILECSV